MALPVDAITIPDRRREDYGDIAGLAASIAKYGLLHPIVLDDEATLVAGGRRLEAVKSLGWDTVPVRAFGELTEAERHEIELEENLQRKDLTPYERSKTLVKLAETARTVLQEQAELRTDSVRNGPGRPKEAGSIRDVAERIGEPVTNIVKAQQHVEVADAFPELAGWKQYHALEFREKLERLTEDERPKAVDLIVQPGTHPTTALKVLGALATRPVNERAAIFEKAVSTDARDRSDALTEAAQMPPMPDPRMNIVFDAIAALKKAERMFPDDAMTSAISDVRAAAQTVHIALKEYKRE